MIRKTIAFDEKTVGALNHFAKREKMGFSSALRYAIKVGLLALNNPELTGEEIKDIIEAQVDYETEGISDLNSEDLI